MANRKMTFSRTKIACLTSLMMLASVDVSALGLGVLDVQSNLDQPLNGVIELRVNAGDDVNSVQASIAPRSDFESFGIDYPSYLDDINVTLDRSSGKPKLILDSNGIIIKEPFIHLLIRVDWSGGSFLREYTALIDPPIYAAETPKSFSQPVSVGTDQSYQTEPTQDFTVEEIDPNDSSTEFSGSTSSPSYITPITPDDSSSDSDSSFDSDARYGPVEAGESLSIIAAQLREQFPDLSIYQIMKVLFEENPQAFIDGNINGLIKGSILNLGDINSIRAVDLRDAKNFFAAQASDWNNIRNISDNEGDSLKVGQDLYNDSDDIFSQPLGEIEQQSFQVGASTDTESLISDSDSDTSAGEVVILRQQISELESSLSSSALENQELRERVSILEGQLSDLNDLVKLNVEDASLASLEDALAKSDEAQELGIVTDTETVADIVTGELDSATDAAETALDEVVTDIETSVTDQTLELGSELGTDVAITEEQEPVESSVVENVETSAVPKPKPIIIPPAEPSLFDKIKSFLFEGGFWKILAGIGVILIGALAALFIRRRRADEEFEISMLSIESNSQSINTVDTASLSRSMSASVTASINEEDADADKETSFLTVYSDTDAVVQADEVDPIAEADVYIAYGRHEQAEEVLLDGVTNYPERSDIKHKLLSVYHKNSNTEGFERVAEELYSQRDSLEPDVWSDICQMGREMDLDNPLYQLSENDIATPSVDTEGADDVAGEPTEAEIEEVVPQDTPESESVEQNSRFDVDDQSVQLINFDEGRSEISELDEVQIDALDVDATNDATNNIDIAADDDLDISDDVLEFDDADLEIALDSDDGDLEIDQDQEEDESDDIEINDSIMEFDDDDAADEIEINDSVIEIDEGDDIDEIEINDSVIEIDEGDNIDIDIEINDSEEIVSHDDIDSDLDDDSENFDLGDLQEVSGLEVDDDYDELRTQYELAKVFADLGDEDGARKILNDIIDDATASDDLVADSKALLGTIS